METFFVVEVSMYLYFHLSYLIKTTVRFAIFGKPG